MPLSAPIDTLIRALRRGFAERTKAGGFRVFFAPGRINLVGAHLDYNGGDVLPLALDRGVYVAAALRDDGVICLESFDQGPPLRLCAEDLGRRADPRHGWASYPLGVWHGFAEATGHRSGLQLLFSGDLALASGLSSSAAIEVATAVALDRLHGTALAEEEIAMIAHRAETEYVGLRCGIMDQFASALGRRGHLLLLHCRDRRAEYVSVEEGAFEVLLMDTCKPRRLAASRFNQRVEECARAHQVLRQRVRNLPALADYSLSDLEAAGGALDGVLLRRARHVVTEMQRVARGVAGLRRGEIRVLGEAMDASHRSSREDYEVSCEELDAITDAAREVEGVFGARLTGAGFGGCAVALVEPGRTEAVMAQVRQRHVARFGVEPAFAVLHPGSGPREIV